MKETDAQRKRCPLTRTNCIGSECMMWECLPNYIPAIGHYPAVWINPGKPKYIPEGDCGLKAKDLGD